MSGRGPEQFVLDEAEEDGARRRRAILSPVRRRRNCSTVWLYFDKKVDKIVCNVPLCNKSYSKTTGTSTLATHLANAHEITLTSTNAQNQNNLAEVLNVESPLYPPLSQNKQNANTKQLLEFLTDNLQPFALVDNQSFIEFVRTLNPNYRLPDRKTIREHLKQEYATKFARLKRFFASCESKINLTLDIWSSIASEPYIAFTAHLIDNTWTLRSFLLDIYYFPFPHDGKSIAFAIYDVNEQNFFLNDRN